MTAPTDPMTTDHRPGDVLPAGTRVYKVDDFDVSRGGGPVLATAIVISCGPKAARLNFRSADARYGYAWTKTGRAVWDPRDLYTTPAAAWAAYAASSAAEITTLKKRLDALEAAYATAARRRDIRGEP